jgi:hypothetical protein
MSMRCRAILHDPQVYPEPDAFRPERFLEAGPDGTLQMNKKVLDPRTVIFGYGRRSVSSPPLRSARACSCAAQDLPGPARRGGHGLDRVRVAAGDDADRRGWCCAAVGEVRVGDHRDP